MHSRFTYNRNDKKNKKTTFDGIQLEFHQVWHQPKGMPIAIKFFLSSFSLPLLSNFDTIVDRVCVWKISINYTSIVWHREEILLIKRVEIKISFVNCVTIQRIFSKRIFRITSFHGASNQYLQYLLLLVKLNFHLIILCLWIYSFKF